MISMGSILDITRTPLSATRGSPLRFEKSKNLAVGGIFGQWPRPFKSSLLAVAGMSPEMLDLSRIATMPADSAAPYPAA